MDDEERAKTIERIIQVMLDAGWKMDRYGHVQATLRGYNRHGKIIERRYRLRFKDRVCRLEALVIHPATETTKETKEWIRVTSAMYHEIVFLDDGRIRISGYLLGKTPKGKVKA